METELDDQVDIVEEAPSALEVPLEGDDLVKVGDWEGKAGDFRKHWIPQTSLQEMREKDKAEIARQVAAESTRMATEYQQAMYQQAMQRANQPQQQQQQPQQQQGGMTDRIATAMNEARTGHSGFMHVDTLEPLLGQLIQAVNHEFAARDRMQGAVGQRLDEWYGQYQQQGKMVDTVSTAYADREWDKFIGELSDSYPGVPESTLETLACAYEAEPGESPAQLRQAISGLIGEHVDGMKAHEATVRKQEREKQQRERAAGLPGVGGQASPSKQGKPLRTAEEITNAFFNADEPPA